MSTEPEYLTIKDVAERIGRSLKTLHEYRSKGYLPEPDLVWLRHPLWLKETIDEWIKWRGKWGKNRPHRFRYASHRVRTKDTTTRSRPPKLASSNGASAKPAKRTNRKKITSTRALPKPAESVIDEALAREIAKMLRQEGRYCTAEDVLFLANHDGEVEHEQEVLRARVKAKLRGLEARK